MNRLSALIPSVLFAVILSAIAWTEREVSRGHSPAIVVRLSGDHPETALLESPTDARREIAQLLATYDNNVPFLAWPVYQDANRDQQQLLLAQQGRRWIQQGDYDRVLTTGDALSLDERLAGRFQFSYALALSRLRETDRSEQAYRDLLDATPEHQAGTINLGLMLNDLERYDDAASVLAVAATITSGDRKAKSLAALARAERKRGNLRAAEDALTRSIEYRPAHATTWLRLADLRAQRGRPFDETARTYTRACGLDPENHNCHYKAGRFFLSRLALDRAYDSLSRARNLADTNPQIRRELAWVLYESGQFSASRIEWQWLSANASTSRQRRLAKHLLALIDDAEISQHMAPTSDERRYALALTSTRHLNLLEQIDPGSRFYYRGQLALLKHHTAEKQYNLADSARAQLDTDAVSPVQLQPYLSRMQTAVPVKTQLADTRNTP